VISALTAIVCENCGVKIDQYKTVCSQCMCEYESFSRNCECEELVICNHCEHCSIINKFEQEMIKMEQYLKEMQKKQLDELKPFELLQGQVKRYEKMLNLSKTDYDLLELRVEIEFFQKLFYIIH
jgi:hypothetical protein